jgi:L-ascorbate metabolism protein UlaG (beta-lactamase superfamily)
VMIPVSGDFVMDAKEAASLINLIKPKFAIPMHYGAGVVGTQEDAEKFKSLVTGSQVIIL